MINQLVYFVLFIVVLGVVLMLLDYIIRIVPMQEPFRRIARIILAVIGALILIFLLLGLLGDGGTVKLPRIG